MEYSGVAATDVHRDWLDSTLDRCTMYMAGKDKGFVISLCGDDEFMDKVEKYFSGTMMEARRLLEPVEADDAGDKDSGDESSAESSA